MIITKDNVEIDLSSYNARCLNFNISTPSLKTEIEQIEGRDGFVLIDSQYEARTIDVQLLFESADRTDYHLLREELLRVFLSKKEFYVTYKKEPLKRYKVISSNPLLPERINAFTGILNLQFICFQPYAESLGTTLGDPFTFDSEKWGVGIGLNDEDPKYIHNTATFRIFNAGTETIDPRTLPLLINFEGSSSNLSIRNNTSGDVWTYTGTTLAEDCVILDGIRSMKNDISIFGQTNRKLISILPGWNDFEITGATDFEISFDFRFYYL